MHGSLTHSLSDNNVSSCIYNFFSFFSETFQTIISTTSTLTSSQELQTSNMGAPSNGSKTAHSKVANGTNAATSGNTTNQMTTTSKRSSSSADGDYQLVQHEVLYSQSSQYEVSFACWLHFFLLLEIFFRFFHHRRRRRRHVRSRL